MLCRFGWGNRKGGILIRISHQGHGRAGLQPRRHKPLRNNRVFRSPISLRPQADRGTGQTNQPGSYFGGAEAPPLLY